MITLTLLALVVHGGLTTAPRTHPLPVPLMAVLGPGQECDLRLAGPTRLRVRLAECARLSVCASVVDDGDGYTIVVDAERLTAPRRACYPSPAR